MRAFIFGTMMFIIECSIFHIWWTKIYIHERKSNVTIKKLIIDSCAFFYYLCHQKYSDEVAENKREILIFFYKIFIYIMMMGLIIGISIIPSLINMNIIYQIIFMLFNTFASINLIKDLRKYLIKELDDYIDFLKKYQKVRSDVNSKIFNKINFKDIIFGKRKNILYKKVIFATIVISLVILIHYKIYKILRRIESNTIEIIVIIVVLMILVMILDNDKKKDFKEKIIKIKNSIKIKNNINISICAELENWKDDIFRMCERLHINSVYIVMDNDVQDIAMATREKQNPFFVKISRYYFEHMHQYFGKDIFKKVFMFIIGHELAHVYFNDINEKKTPLICLFIYLGFIFYLFGTAVLLLKYKILSFIVILIWGCLLVFIFLFIVSIMTDMRYWKQIKELRADRIGMEVSDTMPNVFDEFISYYEYLLNNRDNDKENIIYFFYKQYIEVEEHPDLQRRSIELHRNKKWRITEYFRYSRMIRCKLCKFGGWRL